MIDLKGYSGFCLTTEDHSPEANNISMYCMMKDISVVRVKESYSCLHNLIPSGSVDWCLKSLGKHITPNYYPQWCKHLLYRNVWKGDKWLLQKVFVKPADRHKRFTGFITNGTYSKKKKPPFWFSDIVQFTDEYRYYVTEGKVVFADWYWNEDNPDGTIIQPPQLELDVPNDWSGTIDMGYLATSEFALIECHPPFACGWYGGSNNIEVYMQWLIDGWIYLNNLKGE